MVGERRSCPLCGETANRSLHLTSATYDSEALVGGNGENLTVTARKATT